MTGASVSTLPSSSFTAGTVARYRLQEWLNFISTELHKGFAPLFNKKTPEEYRGMVLERLNTHFGYLAQQLAGKQYLMGDKFTVADAYLYTVTRWAPRIEFDLAPFPNVQAFMKRVGERPKVQEALKAEGLQ